jgi:DNA-binding NarL/FixJ family response regulator
MDLYPPISLVIADDHPMTTLGLKCLFDNEPDFAVLDAVTDGQQTLRAVRELKPDVLMLDISMPVLDGFGVLQQLHADGLACKTVVYTYQMDDQRLLESMQWGVCGVVLKTMPPPLLLQALRKVHAGGQWLEMESVGRVLDRDIAQRRIYESLTPKERELIKVVALGLRSRAITERLHIQEGTVRIHLSNIYKKLNLSGRGALIAFAQQHDLA